MADTDPVTPCPACRGTGEVDDPDDWRCQNAGGLPCPTCGGSGNTASAGLSTRGALEYLHGYADVARAAERGIYLVDRTHPDARRHLGRAEALDAVAAALRLALQPPVTEAALLAALATLSEPPDPRWV